MMMSIFFTPGLETARHATPRGTAPARVAADGSPRWLLCITGLLAGSAALRGVSARWSAPQPAPAPGRGLPPPAAAPGPQAGPACRLGAPAPGLLPPRLDAVQSERDALAARVADPYAAGGDPTRADVDRLLACWGAEDEPNFMDFLAAAAPCDATWGHLDRPLWGVDDEVLRGDAGIRARELRANDEGARPRAAALASLVWQVPDRVAGFLTAGDGHVQANLRVPPGTGEGGGDVVALTMSTRLPLDSAGQPLGYADRRGIGWPLVNKLAVKLRNCDTRIRLDTGDQMLAAVLGYNDTITLAPSNYISMAADIHEVIRTVGPVMGTVVPQGWYRMRSMLCPTSSGPDCGGSDGKWELDLVFPRSHFVTIRSTRPDIDLRLDPNVVYGLLDTHLDAWPPWLEVFDPSASDAVANATNPYHRDGNSPIFGLPIDVADALGMSLSLRGR